LSQVFIKGLLLTGNEFMNEIMIENDKLVVIWGVIASLFIFVITLQYEINQDRHQFELAAGKITAEIQETFDKIIKINREFSALYYLTNEVDQNAFDFLTGSLIRQNSFIETIYFAEKINTSDKSEYEHLLEEQGYTGFKVKSFPGNLYADSINPDYLFPIKYIEPYSVKSSGWFGLDILTFSVIQQSLSVERKLSELVYSVDVKGMNKLFASRIFFNGYSNGANDLLDDAFGILLYKIDVAQFFTHQFLSEYDSVKLSLSDKPLYSIRYNQQNELFSKEFVVRNKIELFKQDFQIEIKRVKGIFQFSLLFPLLVLSVGLMLAFFGWHAFRTNKIRNKFLAEQNNVVEREVRKKTKELTSAYARQLALTEELEAFSYSVSHDLRSPLRTLDGFARALEEDFGHKLNDEARDFISRICNASERMGSLIDALLSLSRITRKELIIETFNISDVAKTISGTLMEEEPERNVIFKIQPDIIVDADKNLVEVVLDNLIRNAWKYSQREEQSIIEFGTKELDNQQVFYVEDNGVGFDMEYSERLFGSFQRLHHQNDFEGDGIGLATAKRIILRHTGRIWAEATVDKGAIFYFTLVE